MQEHSGIMKSRLLTVKNTANTKKPKQLFLMSCVYIMRLLDAKNIANVMTHIL